MEDSAKCEFSLTSTLFFRILGLQVTGSHPLGDSALLGLRFLDRLKKEDEERTKLVIYEIFRLKGKQLMLT